MVNASNAQSVSNTHSCLVCKHSFGPQGTINQTLFYEQQSEGLFCNFLVRPGVRVADISNTTEKCANATVNATGLSLVPTNRGNL